MGDITTTEISVALGGSVTVGALIMLILQNVKALVPRLEGIGAEIAGGVASLAAVMLAFELADGDWNATRTYAELFVAWMSAWVTARATYSLLFKASVRDVPLPPDVELPHPTIDRRLHGQ